jgi:hypothetical protein
MVSDGVAVNCTMMTITRTYRISESVEIKWLTVPCNPRIYTLTTTQLHPASKVLHSDCHGPSPYFPGSTQKLPHSFTVFPRTYTGGREPGSGITAQVWRCCARVSACWTSKLPRNYTDLDADAIARALIVLRSDETSATFLGATPYSMTAHENFNRVFHVTTLK